MIETSKGEVVVGGLSTINRKERYISPTIIKNPDLNSELMSQEIFGPVLPVVTFKDFDEVINNHINGQGKEKPLAVYYFGNCNSKNFKRLAAETSSGNLSANDTLHHTLDIELGFGGVGHSGIGRVGGFDGFKQMSN